jgi:hypothetical protein
MNRARQLAMNYESFWVGVVTGVVLMILLNIRRSRRAMRRPNLDVPPATPPTLPPELRAQLLRMKAEGQMIAAIKLVRDRTNCDLKAAKDAVEMLR